MSADNLKGSNSTQLNLARTMTDWRPIETAPKDGKTIIAGGYDDGDWEQVVIWWDSNCHTCTTCGHVKDVSRWKINLTLGDFYDHIQLTHWMSLPEPPGKEG